MTDYIKLRALTARDIYAHFAAMYPSDPAVVPEELDNLASGLRKVATHVRTGVTAPNPGYVGPSIHEKPLVSVHVGLPSAPRRGEWLATLVPAIQQALEHPSRVQVLATETSSIKPTLYDGALSSQVDGKLVFADGTEIPLSDVVTFAIVQQYEDDLITPLGED